MIDTNTVSINFIKKEVFTGSDNGMRYRLEKGDEELLAYVWPEPFNFASTDDSLKECAHFEWSSQGKEDAVKWLNDMHSARADFWAEMKRRPLTEIFANHQKQ